MDRDRKLLKVAGISYGILGVFLLGSPLYGIILMMIGLYFFSQSLESEETIRQNRVIYYILSGFGIINIIGFIFVFIAQDNIAKRYRIANGIKAPPKIIYKMDKESRKIDLLLKLGVLMVFISGVLFATTSWDFVTDYIKALLLMIAGTIFLVLSIFTEKRLKLYRSSYMYWLLSISLYFLTIVGFLYFGVLGSYLTYDGAGSNLAYAITYLTGAGFALTTYLKFPKKYLLYTCYAGLVAGIANLLAYMNLSTTMNISIISVLVMILNTIYKKNGTISTFSKLLPYLLFAFLMRTTPTGTVDELIAYIINIINLNYLTYMNEKENESTINMILTYILIFFGCYNFALFGELNFLMIALATTTYTLMILDRIVHTKDYIKRINYIIYMVSMTIIYLLTSKETSTPLMITNITIPLLQLLTTIIVKHGLWGVSSWKVANFIQPLIYFGIIDASITCLGDTISPIAELSLLAIIYSLTHAIYRNPIDKKISCGYLLFTIFISLYLEYGYQDILAAITMVVVNLYVFATFYMKEETNSNKWLEGITYVLLLSSIFVPFVYDNLLDLEIFFPSLILIILILTMAILLKQDLIKKISYLYIIAPLLTLIEMSGLDYTMIEILKNVTGLYVIFLIIKFFLKDKISINIVSIIGIIYFSSQIFLMEDVLIGIYLGIVGLAIILIGYQKDEYFPLMITGIVLTIINIVYRLKEVWKLIPFWLYLLIGGLTIITFVTYRELKKQKK